MATTSTHTSSRPPAEGRVERFNATERWLHWAVAGPLTLAIMTGVALFPPFHAPFWLLENSRNLHNITAFLLVPLVLGHVFLSAVYSPTRPGLPGIFNGYVPEAWLRHHHPLDAVSGSRDQPSP